MLLIKTIILMFTKFDETVLVLEWYRNYYISLDKFVLTFHSNVIHKKIILLYTGKHSPNTQQNIPPIHTEGNIPLLLTEIYIYY